MAGNNSISGAWVLDLSRLVESTESDGLKKSSIDVCICPRPYGIFLPSLRRSLPLVDYHRTAIRVHLFRGGLASNFYFHGLRTEFFDGDMKFLNSNSKHLSPNLGRSDRMEGYLRCMRMPESAIQHQIHQEQASESRNVIALDNHTLVIFKRTWVRTFTETLVLGEERAVEGGAGPRRSVATLGESGQNDGYIITSVLTASGGDMVVVEARQLVDNGLSHVQEINITNLTTGMQNVTHRLWVRVPMTDDDRAHLSAEQAS